MMNRSSGILFKLGVTWIDLVVLLTGWIVYAALMIGSSTPIEMLCLLSSFMVMWGLYGWYNGNSRLVYGAYIFMLMLVLDRLGDMEGDDKMWGLSGLLLILLITSVTSMVRGRGVRGYMVSVISNVFYYCLMYLMLGVYREVIYGKVSIECVIVGVLSVIIVYKLYRMIRSGVMIEQGGKYPEGYKSEVLEMLEGLIREVRPIFLTYLISNLCGGLNIIGGDIVYKEFYMLLYFSYISMKLIDTIVYMLYCNSIGKDLPVNELVISMVGILLLIGIYTDCWLVSSVLERVLYNDEHKFILIVIITYIFRNKIHG